MKLKIGRWLSTMTMSAVLVLGLSGCFSDKNENEIIMGVSPGPYNELFDAAIAPILTAEGFTLKNVNFSALIESNIAMTEGAVDVVVAQHAGYMKVFNDQRNTDLIAVTMIPTVPAGIFSNKFQSITDIGQNMVVLIPQDASNAARAYALLAKAKWITLKPNTDLMQANKNDILENPYALDIKEIDSNLIPRVLEDTDFAVIPGSIVWLGKLDPSRVLLQETLLPELYLQVVIREEDRDTKWAKAIVAAYNSKAFKDYMGVNNAYNYWTLPPALEALE